MRLDDRPVIDQLLNPTPLNHLYDVQNEMWDVICGDADDLQLAVDETLFTLMDWVPAWDREDAHSSFARVGTELAEREEVRRRDLLTAFVEAMEARL